MWAASAFTLPPVGGEGRPRERSSRGRGGGTTLAPSKLRPPPLTPPRHALRARGEGKESCPMRLLVTRPVPDGARTAAALRARGHGAQLAPLLRVAHDPAAEL